MFGISVVLNGLEIIEISLPTMPKDYIITPMTIESNYNYIASLVSKEIDDIVDESFADSGYDSKEKYRDEQIGLYLYYMKKDLQSDNA